MGSATPASVALRDSIRLNRPALDAIMTRYGAGNPRLFGSVARGDATATSDIDVLVDLAQPHERILMRLGGLTEEFRRILGHPVDVVAPQILRRQVSSTAIDDAVDL